MAASYETSTTKTPKKQKIRTVVRNEVEQKWLDSNAIPDKGELVYGSDVNTLKIGDGIHKYEDLPAISGGEQGTTNYNDLENKPSINNVTLVGNSTTEDLGFATVATSGLYNDLSGKPTIGNATITFTQGGATKGSFTTNQTDNSTISLDITTVVDNVTTTSATDALSANMGKELQDEINNLKARGRYLSLWNCATGLAQTDPTVSPYNYATGDYFIVGTVAASGQTNYRPDGSSYTIDVASTTVETNTVSPDDTYIYDGTRWILQYNTQKTVSFANIAGQPTDNSNLAAALNAKQDVLTPGTDIAINENNVISFTNTTGYALQSSLESHENDTDNPHAVTKSQVGLGNVDNTSDLNKPISTATQTALNAKQDTLTAGTNITIDANNVISSTAQESFFRGRWGNWSLVPSNGNEYPEDYHGNRKPTDNDFMVLSDASDYVNPSSLTHPFTVINTHSTAQFTINFIDEYSVEHTYYYAPYQSDWVQINEHYSLRYVSGAPGRWYIRTNKPEDTHIVVNGIEYEVDPTGTTVSAGVLICQTDYSTTPISGGLPSQVGQYQGAWRFVYHGDWDTNGKLGWTPQYQIENTLPIATDTEPGIAKLYNTTGQNTDGSITQKLFTDTTDNKLDKVTTASKLYGTTDQGVQTTITYDRQNATPSTIVQRDLSGQINIPLVPTADKHAASKQYVDNSIKDATITITQGGATKGSFTVNQSANATIALDAGGGTVDQVYNATSTNAQSGTAVAGAIANKVTRTTVSSGAVAYGENSSGETTFTVTQSANNYALVQRTSTGQITVKLTPAANSDATSKKYVDDSIATKATITLRDWSINS